MQRFILPRDNDKNVEFVGELLATVSSRADNSTRWTIIKIFKTKAGQWIAGIVGRTLFEDEVDRFAVHVCGSDNDKLIDALRTESGELGWLAKEALDNVGVDYTEFVE